jgi:hypothetical protein
MTEACTAGSATEELLREVSALEAKLLDASLSASVHRSSLPIPGDPIHGIPVEGAHMHGTPGGSLPEGSSKESPVRHRRAHDGSRILDPGVIQRCVLEAARGSKEYVRAFTAGRGAE